MCLDNGSEVRVWFEIGLVVRVRPNAGFELGLGLWLVLGFEIGLGLNIKLDLRLVYN